MKANATALLRLLAQGASQFTIPIYQRPYSWSEAECERLLHDALRVGADAERPAYFIGSIVYFEEAAHAIGMVRQFLVIDGQQRMTTVLLMLAALAECQVAAEGTDEAAAGTVGITSKKLRNYYLTNPDETDDLRYKLLLTRKDRPTLASILRGVPRPADASERVAANYAYFRAAITPDNAAGLWAGLQKLMVVSVALEAGVDNPQLIFESLNSTGMALAQADLIRNFILMGLARDTQTRLYDQYWYPMEDAFGEAYAALFDSFVRDLLTMKTGRIRKREQVYEFFKEDYVKGRSSAAEMEAIAAEMYRCAGCYVRLRRPATTEPDPALRLALTDLQELRADVVYPFLLEASVDCQLGRLSLADLTALVRLVAAYVLRRAVVGVPTNTLSKTFAVFGRHLDKSRYLASASERLLSLQDAQRFPDDGEFTHSLVTRNTYDATRTRDYLLDRLENHGRRERVPTAEFTVEHILPQNPRLRPEWREMLGPQWRQVQEKYLHTLGNLTLTGYNGKLSDRPFAYKRTVEGGFVDSPLHLNRSVAAEAVWNEAAILRRAHKLAARAVAIWPAPVATPVSAAPASAAPES